MSKNMILAIDPGSESSGYVVYCRKDHEVVESGNVSNGETISIIADFCSVWGGDSVLKIEMIASYGMPVGKDVFETCRWIGRFEQVAHEYDAEVQMIYRRDVKMALCGSMKANDSTIRKAIIDLFPKTGGGKKPQIGTKKEPGPLYGVTSHAWQALGVALTEVMFKDEK